MWLGCLLLFAIVPHDWVATDHVDVIEDSKVYDCCGMLYVHQVIFWSFNRGRMEVVAWRMVKDQHQLPRWDWRANDAFTIWNDEGIVREVRAKSVLHSWEMHDREIDDREILPKELRRELKQP